MTGTTVTNAPARDIQAMLAHTQFGSSATDSSAVGSYHDDDDDLNQRIAEFKRANDELEAAERHAIALREAGDVEADIAQEHVDKLLQLAIGRLNAVFEFQPTTLRSAIGLLLCSIDSFALDRDDAAAIMNTNACARALRVIQELTGIERRLAW